ncbi:unnamed protein product [Mytilus edulis]|uniref:Uncharacterized protein n=1 Tax=Mytilus edulis TaxID=6550 RepID=A0A8S3QKC4_MYTED|nr:unnamed protein product [Mytilus edulis]
MDIDIAGPIIDAIVKKQSVILKLDEQILENTSDEDIEVEITDADEYNLDLETNLRRYKKLAQTVTRTCTELSHESIPNTRPVMNMHEVNSETRPSLGIQENDKLNTEKQNIKEFSSCTKQKKRGFIEKVEEKEDSQRIHYIPHNPVKKNDNDESQILRRSVRLQNRNQRL